MVDSFLKQDASNLFKSIGGYEGWRSWNDLKEAMKDYFIPKNEAFKTRDSWCELKQDQGLIDYLNKYRSLMLRILDMNEVDRLHGLLYGLKPWAWREIEKQNPTVWEDVSTRVERLYNTNGPPNQGSQTRTGNATNTAQNPQRGSNRASDNRPNEVRPTQSNSTRGSQQNWSNTFGILNFKF